MPIDLVLVRHAASIGNEAYERSKRGDHSGYTQRFRMLPNWAWPLSGTGREQARATGAWLREHLPDPSSYYCSPFVRTFETAALLGFPDACWEPDGLLRERFWGEADFRVPENERWDAFREQLQGRWHDPAYWRPPGGESLADVEVRVEHFLEKLHRAWPNGKVLVVTHRDTMLAVAARIAPRPLPEWRQELLSKAPEDQIHNAQVVHYSRRNPHSGDVGVRFGWVRSVCPWDSSRSHNDWRPVKAPNLRNEELLAVAQATSGIDWGVPPRSSDGVGGRPHRGRA